MAKPRSGPSDDGPAPVEDHHGRKHPHGIGNGADRIPADFFEKTGVERARKHHDVEAEHGGNSQPKQQAGASPGRGPRFEWNGLVPEARDSVEDCPRVQAVGQILDAGDVGEKENGRFHDAVHPSKDLFDEPGTGGAPHAPDVHGKLLGEVFIDWLGGRRGGTGGGRFPGGAFLRWGSDQAGFEARFVKRSLPVVFGDPAGAVEKDLKNVEAAGAAKAQNPSPGRRLGDTSRRGGKSAKSAGVFNAIITQGPRSPSERAAHPSPSRTGPRPFVRAFAF